MKAPRDSRQERVAIAWHGLPLYAASAIAAAVEKGGWPVDVIATKPAVPAAGMEARIGLPVHWIDAAAFPSFGGLGLAVPRVLFVTGWAVPAFMRLVREAKRAGTKVVAMVDNSFRGDLRQLAGAIAYRILYRRLFDHVWVPGRSASRLMRFYGVPGHRISTGLYTADTSIFTHRTPIETRPMRFVYAGQLVGRKNVVAMCEAFLEFRRSIAGPCDLRVFGSGPLRDRIPNHPDIHVHPFAPPDALADVFNDARCLVLPSTIDHWGVVVHEAAACGTLLIASDSTGAAADLCGPDNSRLVRASDRGDLIEAFRWAATLSPTRLAAGSRQSRELAAAFSPDRWAATFHEMCSRLVAEGSSA